MFSKGKEFDHYTLQNQSKVTKEDLFGVNIPKNYHKYSFTRDSLGSHYFLTSLRLENSFVLNCNDSTFWSSMCYTNAVILMSQF